LLKNKTALVTGSNSGICLGISKALAAQGANIELKGFGGVADEVGVIFRVGGPAHKGAVTHAGGKAEVVCYADI